MTFDKWIDDVNAQVRTRLGEGVRTEELSWDSAHWVSASGTAVATLADDETTAKISFDGGDRMSMQFRGPDADPSVVGAAIAARLSRS